MTTAVLELNVSGMICRACEDAIADALLHTRGVISMARSASPNSAGALLARPRDDHV